MAIALGIVIGVALSAMGIREWMRPVEFTWSRRFWTVRGRLGSLVLVAIGGVTLVASVAALGS